MPKKKTNIKNSVDKKKVPETIIKEEPQEEAAPQPRSHANKLNNQKVTVHAPAAPAPMPAKESQRKGAPTLPVMQHEEKGVVALTPPTTPVVAAPVNPAPASAPASAPVLAPVPAAPAPALIPPAEPVLQAPAVTPPANILPKKPMAQHKDEDIMVPMMPSAPALPMLPKLTPSSAKKPQAPPVAKASDQLTFAPEDTVLNLEHKSKLKGLVAELTQKPETKTKVVAYTPADQKEEDASKSRRVALQRLIGVRKHLIAEGVNPAQITIQAISADKSKNATPENVDLKLIP